jgi:CubicO group peptidase (beta-lactamase class C family)
MTLKSRLDKVLADGVAGNRLPNLVAVVGDRAGTLYEGACGPRTHSATAAMTPDTVLWIASMTKAITATAVMQLVEQGKLALDAPAHEVLPALAHRQVLTGFDAQGQPQLRPPRRAITLRHLLTHTAGFGYEFANAEVGRYVAATGTPNILSCERRALELPLLFDPGDQWEYGIGIDWAGLMLEQVSGKSLGQYLQDHVCGPLGMTSTSFKLSEGQRARVAGMHARAADGSLAPLALEMPQSAGFDMGGGALYSSPRDYLRFMRMILNGGVLEGVRVLRAETVADMSRDHCPGLCCGHMPSTSPAISHDADFFPGQRCGWGLSFLINEQAIPGGRAAGSLAWAGLSNAYYWIDPARGVSAMFATQLLPFFDPQTIASLREFERAVYAA